jgi:hypothetical protein
MIRPIEQAPRPAALEADAYLMNIDPLATCLSCTSAHATEGRTGSRSHARAGLLDLAVARGNIASARVGESQSDGVYRGSGSHARSETNGARIDLLGGGSGAVVLHADGSSDSPGHQYLAAIDGVELLPSTGRTVRDGVTVQRALSVALLHEDSTGGAVAVVADGRGQRFARVGATWVGTPSADPQPLR